MTSLRLLAGLVGGVILVTVAYVSFIRGPDTRGVRDLAVWNIHEWEMH